MSTLKELANHLANAFSVRTSFPFSNPGLSPTLGCNSRTPSALVLLQPTFGVGTTFLRTAFGVYTSYKPGFGVGPLATHLRRWYYVLANRLRLLLPLTNPASALVLRSCEPP